MDSVEDLNGKQFKQVSRMQEANLVAFVVYSNAIDDVHGPYLFPSAIKLFNLLAWDEANAAADWQLPQTAATATATATEDFLFRAFWAGQLCVQRASCSSPSCSSPKWVRKSWQRLTAFSIWAANRTHIIIVFWYPVIG